MLFAAKSAYKLAEVMCVQKKLLRLELAGMLFVVVISVFLQNLYEISGRMVVGILFGSVNDSIWEIEKTLLLPYFVWIFIEIMCVRVPFRRFVVAKTISLWCFAFTYSAICILFSAFGEKSHMLPEFIAAIICTVFSFYLSYRLILSEKELGSFYYPSFFMLLLFAAFYCSFTPFPPQLSLFQDRATGLYGIIPEKFDIGAVYLDSIFVV